MYGEFVKVCVAGEKACIVVEIFTNLEEWNVIENNLIWGEL